MAYSLQISRLILVAILAAAILAIAYRPKWLPFIAIAGIGLVYGPVSVGKLQAWNAFHYWMNTKYFAEVGYFDFYNCVRNVGEFGSHARNLNTYEIVPIDDLPTCPQAANFSFARYQAFYQDLKWLRANTPDRPLLWEGMIRDKGLNVTPPWLAIAVPLANKYAAGSPGFWLVVYADTIMMLAALAGLAYWRGSQTAALVAIWLITWPGTLPQLMGHWLQYIWLALLILAAIAWQRRKWGTAGAAIAAAAALRIFPAVLFVWPLLHWRQVSRRFWLAAIATGTAALLIGSSTPRGLAVWPEFFSKMAIHSGYLVIEPGNIGLRNQLDTIMDTDGAIADFAAFETGEIVPGRGKPPSPWLYTPTVFMTIFCLAAIAYRRRMMFGDGVLLMYPLLVVSRYYYAWLALNMSEASPGEAIGLLGMNLIGIILIYYGHPLFGYSAIQYWLLVYVVIKSMPQLATKRSLNRARIFQ